MPEPYPYDPTIRALNAALTALQLARANADSTQAIDLLDQALEYAREAVTCTNAAIRADGDALASVPDDETD
jgi:hypothetical protein